MIELTFEFLIKHLLVAIAYGRVHGVDGLAVDGEALVAAVGAERLQEGVDVYVVEVVDAVLLEMPLV